MNLVNDICAMSLDNSKNDISLNSVNVDPEIIHFLNTTTQLPKELQHLIFRYSHYNNDFFKNILYVSQNRYPLQVKPYSVLNSELFDDSEEFCRGIRVHVVAEELHFIGKCIADILNTQEFKYNPEAYLLEEVTKNYELPKCRYDQEGANPKVYALSTEVVRKNLIHTKAIQFLTPFFIFTTVYSNNSIQVSCDNQAMKNLGLLLLKPTPKRNLTELCNELLNGNSNQIDPEHIDPQHFAQLVKSMIGPVWSFIQAANLDLSDNSNNMGFYSLQKIGDNLK